MKLNNGTVKTVKCYYIPEDVREGQNTWEIISIFAITSVFLGSVCHSI